MTLRRLGTFAVFGLVIVSLVACANRLRPPRHFDVGLPFAADLDALEDERAFVVRVEAPGATLEQARESARFPATFYCVELLGNSEIDWVLDPATGDWAVNRNQDGELLVQGRCARR